MKRKAPNGLARMTESQLNSRLTVLESMMSTRDWKSLPALNDTYQKVMDELVRRDVAAEASKK